MIIKVIELVSSSPESFDAAIAEAVRRANQTVRNVTGVDVLGLKARVKDGQIVEYRANVKVAFEVEEK